MITEISGDHNTVENILIEHTDWLGTLSYKPLGLTGNHNKLLRSTIRYFGNAGVVTSIPNTPAEMIDDNGTQAPPQPMAGRHTGESRHGLPTVPCAHTLCLLFTEVAYNHIHHGGLIGKDSAALYTGGWNTAGLEWHHNWIHTATEKCARVRFPFVGLV